MGNTSPSKSRNFVRTQFHFVVNLQISFRIRRELRPHSCKTRSFASSQPKRNILLSSRYHSPIFFHFHCELCKYRSILYVHSGQVYSLSFQFCRELFHFIPFLLGILMIHSNSIGIFAVSSLICVPLLLWTCAALYFQFCWDLAPFWSWSIEESLAGHSDSVVIRVPNPMGSCSAFLVKLFHMLCDLIPS